MKWFKHKSNAHSDAKIQRVLMRHGAEGYAMYWYCLELIAGGVEGNNITFELEHDAELIGNVLKIDTLRVENIMRTFIELQLFEQSEGKITCLKLAKSLDERWTRNADLKAAIKNTSNCLQTDFRPSSDSLQTVATRLDKNRKEHVQNTSKNEVSRTRVLKSLNVSFEQFWKAYPRKQGKAEAEKKWARLSDSDREAALAFLTRNPYAQTEKQFIPMGSTFLNQRRWEDELLPAPASDKAEDYFL